MKIVVLDGFSLTQGQLTFDCLKEFGEVIVYDRTPKDLIVERAYDCDILLTNKTLVMKETIRELKNLKYIGLLSTGVNVVDLEEATKRNIKVTNVPAYSTASVAQLVFTYMLEDSFKLVNHSNLVKEGKWASCRDFCFTDGALIELENKVLGIYGFGSIGRKVAQIANAFGMKVIVCNRTKYDGFDNITWVDKDTLLKESDYITIHCPLTDETKSLVNAEFLSKMKKNAFLINTSRGGTVDEEALADALNNKKIRGAAVDVLSTEPPRTENPLLTAENIFITPHIGWATIEARTRLLEVVHKNIKSFIEGNTQNLVN